MNVIMPQLGETVEEGTVSVWHKKEGDLVAVDELLVEIETDKVATEVPSLVAGVVQKILVPAGQTVKVGTTLAVIQAAGAAAAPATAVAAGSPSLSSPLSMNTSVPASAPGEPASVPRRADRSLRLSPSVRRLVKEHGVDLSRITGTGRDGRIKRNDVLVHLEAKSVPASASQSAHPTARSATQANTTQIVPFSAMRKRIAEHMIRSQATSAHVLQAIEVDFSAVDAVRSIVRNAWKKRESGSLTYLPFIARAVALALREFPHLNGHVVGDGIVVHQSVNLAVAIDLNHGGLVAPVIRNVGSLRVPEIARAIAKLAERARTNALKPDDMTDGTYSITNNGSFGTLLTAPVINQPQVAILSTDGIHRKPWVVADETGERIEIRPVGVLAQSFDHRAVDGAYSGAYLRLLKRTIETHDWVGDLLL